MIIEEFRKKIDKIDNSIIDLIIERNRFSNEILDYKSKNNINIFDKERENDIIDSLKNKFQDKLNPLEIEQIYKEILFFSKQNYLKHKSLNNYSGLFDTIPLLIAGPCTIESEEQIEKIAADLSSFGIKYLRGGAFKPRTSPDSFQGLGADGLRMIKAAAERNNMKVITEITSPDQLSDYYDLVDIVQIGSRNMFSYQLLKDIGEITANDQKTVILKRSFNATLQEFLYAAGYIINQGNPNVVLCLRGIRTFEQIDSKLRFTPDLGSIAELKSITDLPVIFDPSHATGDAKYVYGISKAAISLGADGIMVETHYEPEISVSDAKQTISYTELKKIFSFIEEIKYAI